MAAAGDECIYECILVRIYALCAFLRNFISVALCEFCHTKKSHLFGRSGSDGLAAPDPPCLPCLAVRGRDYD